MKPTSNALLNRGLSIGAIRAVGTGMSVVVTILIARFLGPEALGIFAYANVIIALAGVPVARGWATMLLRQVARHASFSSESARMYREGTIGALAVSTIFVFVVIVLFELSGGQAASGSAPPHTTWIVLLLAATLFFDQVSALRMSILRGLDRPVWGQLPEMVLRPTIIGVFLVFAWFLFGRSLQLFQLFVGLTVGAASAALVGRYLLRENAIRGGSAGEPRGKLSTWVASASALAVSALLVQLNGHIDILVLGGMVSADQVGIYRAGLQVAALANFGYIALNMLAAQYLSRMIGQQSQGDVAAASTWLARAAFLTAIPLPVALFFVGESFFEFLFGPQFVGGLLPALLISLGYVFSAAIGMARTLLVMQNREFLVMRTTVVALVANLVLCFLLIPAYGIVGASVANLSSAVVWNLLLWWLAWREAGIDTSLFGKEGRPGDC